LIGAGEKFLGTISERVLLPTRRERDGNSMGLPSHFESAEAIQDEL
jgi:hypothetical protein